MCPRRATTPLAETREGQREKKKKNLAFCRGFSLIYYLSAALRRRSSNRQMNHPPPCGGRVPALVPPLSKTPPPPPPPKHKQEREKNWNEVADALPAAYTHPRSGSSTRDSHSFLNHHSVRNFSDTYPSVCTPYLPAQHPKFLLTTVRLCFLFFLRLFFFR